MSLSTQWRIPVRNKNSVLNRIGKIARTVIISFEL